MTENEMDIWHHQLDGHGFGGTLGVGAGQGGLVCCGFWGQKSRTLLGASMRNSAHGKGHEEGGSAYAKAGSSLRNPPGNFRAPTPKTRVCLLYCFVLSPTPLTLQGGCPPPPLSEKELTYSSS